MTVMKTNLIKGIKKEINKQKELKKYKLSPDIELKQIIGNQIYDALQGGVVEQVLRKTKVSSRDTYFRSMMEGHSMKIDEIILSDLYKLCKEVIERLDFRDEVDFYITGDSTVNAYSIASEEDDEPHIVNINSALFDLMSKDELKFVIGHELGHYVLGHYAEMGLKHLWKQFVFLGELQCASEEKRDLLLEATLFNRDYSKELEADKFAVEYSSKEAALKFLSMAHKMVPYNPEIIARYEAIAGYLPETKAVIEMIDFGIFKDAKVISLDSLEEGGEGNV
jgi:Zn-dependent protease with chaperone function